MVQGYVLLINEYCIINHDNSTQAVHDAFHIYTCTKSSLLNNKSTLGVIGQLFQFVAYTQEYAIQFLYIWAYALDKFEELESSVNHNLYVPVLDIFASFTLTGVNDHNVLNVGNDAA